MNINNELYDSIERKNKLLKTFDFNKKNRRGSVWLYELIGNSEIFIGSFPLLESYDKVLGKYYIAYINKKAVFVDNPRPEDFIRAEDKKIGKILELVKFAPDDYRIKERINETYYKKVKRQVLEPKKISQTNEDGVEETITVKVPKFDENGDPIYEIVEIPYKQPLAITQESRDAIRIGTEYERRMQEKRANESWLSKHGMQIATYGILVIMAFAMVFTTVINKNALVESSRELGGQMTEVTKQLSALSPERWATEIITKTERKEAEDNAPPK